MKFMLMMNAPRGTGDWNVVTWAPEDFRAHIAFMKSFARALSAEGVLVGAEGLSSPAQARVVRAGKAGEPVVTDGPFAEAKEFLAGYWIVQVDSAAEAYAIRGAGLDGARSRRQADAPRHRGARGHERAASGLGGPSRRGPGERGLHAADRA